MRWFGEIWRLIVSFGHDDATGKWEYWIFLPVLVRTFVYPREIKYFVVCVVILRLFKVTPDLDLLNMLT